MIRIPHLFITALLLTVSFAVAEKPTGNYDFNVHANFYSGLPNSVLSAVGTYENGMCSYVGDIRLNPLKGRCRSILVLHLYSIKGGFGGFECGYDTDINGTVMMYTEHDGGCPDVLAIDQASGRVLWEHHFKYNDNQADYWDDEFHCGFDVNIDDDYWAAHPEIHEQVAYRMHYDWKKRIPNGR